MVAPSLLTFLKAEFKQQSYILQNDEKTYRRKRQRVYTFIRIPRELEKFLMYGLMQCADVFLFIYTLLPIRVFLALCTLCTKPFCKQQDTSWLDEPSICDILKGIILLSCSMLLFCIDTSVIYHLVRGQAVIKLYIFFNMLEIADKLFTSFGQDILDALFWTAAEKRSRKREHLGTLPHLCLAILYVFLHSLLILLQATTLNVAFNSHNKALLTIMMSNNFVELKGSVFKKFEKNNLFQMSCSDVRERFYYLVLLLIVMIRNMTSFSWDVEYLWVLMPDIVMVLIAEVLVDWVKHAFITKFNEISSDIYKDYRASLAYDMLNITQKTQAFSDHSDTVSRRIGFIPLPLSVLLTRIVIQSVHFTGYFSIVLTVLFYLCLLSLKLLVGILLLGQTCDIISEHQQQVLRQQSAPPTPAKMYSKDILIGDQMLASFTELHGTAGSSAERSDRPRWGGRGVTAHHHLTTSVSSHSLTDLYSAPPRYDAGPQWPHSGPTQGLHDTLATTSLEACKEELRNAQGDVVLANTRGLGDTEKQGVTCNRRGNAADDEYIVITGEVDAADATLLRKRTTTVPAAADTQPPRQCDDGDSDQKVPNISCAPPADNTSNNQQHSHQE